jgi:hypothetical protein
MLLILSGTRADVGMMRRSVFLSTVLLACSDVPPALPMHGEPPPAETFPSSALDAAVASDSPAVEETPPPVDRLVYAKGPNLYTLTVEEPEPELIWSVSNMTYGALVGDRILAWGAGLQSMDISTRKTTTIEPVAEQIVHMEVIDAQSVLYVVGPREASHPADWRAAPVEVRWWSGETSQTVAVSSPESQLLAVSQARPEAVVMDAAGTLRMVGADSEPIVLMTAANYPFLLPENWRSSYVHQSGKGPLVVFSPDGNELMVVNPGPTEDIDDQETPNTVYRVRLTGEDSTEGVIVQSEELDNCASWWCDVYELSWRAETGPLLVAAYYESFTIPISMDSDSGRTEVATCLFYRHHDEQWTQEVVDSCRSLPPESRPEDGLMVERRATDGGYALFSGSRLLVPAVTQAEEELMVGWESIGREPWGMPENLHLFPAVSWRWWPDGQHLVVYQMTHYVFYSDDSDVCGGDAFKCPQPRVEPTWLWLVDAQGEDSPIQLETSVTRELNSFRDTPGTMPGVADTWVSWAPLFARWSPNTQAVLTPAGELLTRDGRRLHTDLEHDWQGWVFEGGD